MRRLFLLLAAGSLLVVTGCGGSTASPFAGTWKVTALPAGKEITMWLVRIDSQPDGLHAAVVSSGMPDFAGATIDEVRADGDALHLTLVVRDQRCAFVVRRPAGEAAPKQLLGSTGIRGERDFARLERTDLKALDGQQAIVVHESGDELRRTLGSEGGPAKEAALRQLAERHAGQSAEYNARLWLVEALAERGAEQEARAEGDWAAAFAAAYGPEMRRQALRHLAEEVLISGKLSPLAVDYARRAEQTLEPSTPAEERLTVLKVLARALRTAGQDGEADEVGRRVAQAEEEIDHAFEAKALPFEPAPFSGRRGKSERVALVELFTGANCPPCVAADLAFDALLRTYAPRDVVLVQYHLHIPTPDPLTNHDAERRAHYYGLGGTPMIFMDGRPAPPSGGDRDRAREVYDRLLGGLGEELETAAPCSLKVTAERHGERIDLTVAADGLTRRGTVRLRLMLLEDVVRFPGGNGQRLHHHVVRAFPGGVEGIAVSGPTARHQVTVDVAALRKSLREELAGHRAFKGGDWPVDLKRLKVVALLQDDASKEVIQVAQADVPEG
jgi:hypothetical protein